MVKSSKSLVLFAAILFCGISNVGALGSSRTGEYRAPFSILDMLPELHEAAQDFIAFKR